MILDSVLNYRNILINERLNDFVKFVTFMTRTVISCFYLLSLQIMIHSLFLINTSGDVFLEKHWKSVISRSVVDYFFDAQNKAANNHDIPPVIATPHHYLISIYR